MVFSKRTRCFNVCHEMGLKSVKGGWVNEDLYRMKQIFWVSTAKKNTLSARLRVTAADGDRSFVTGLSENDVDPIQRWCEEHNCGVRTSFDMFKFKNKKEMTMFLLRWGS